MTHDAELKAAAYLAHSLTPSERDAFEGHLMECEECWREVEAGRRGLHAAERVRRLAPPHLRETIRDSADSGPRRGRVVRIRLLAAALVIVAGAGVATVVATRPGEHDVMDAAVAVYEASRLPGSSMPSIPAPDLSKLRLSEVGSGAGDLAGLPVNAYAFRDPAGRRLTVYIGKRAFPMAADARPLKGEDGPWLARHDGTTVLCARYPHELLIVGKDQALVRAAAEALEVV